MGVRDWFSAKRDQHRVDQLLNDGNYEEAAAVADRGKVDSDLARIAHEKLAIAESIRNNAAGNLAARLSDRTDHIVERVLKGGEPPSRREALAVRARVRQLLGRGNSADALDLALRITEPEIQAQALRCVAVAVAPTAPSDARSLIGAMSNARYRTEELRNLFLSRLILRDFTTARQIAEDLPPATQGELAERVSQAVQDSLIAALPAQPPKAEWQEILALVERYHTRPDAAREESGKPLEEIRIPLAVIQCISGRIDAAATVLQETALLSMEHGRMQQGLFGTFAMSLAHAGHKDQALQLLTLYEGPSLFRAEAHLLGHVAYPMHVYREFAARTDRGKIDEAFLTECGTMLGGVGLELMVMEEASEAGAMVAAVTNPEIRRVMLAGMVDFVHAMLYT